MGRKWRRGVVAIVLVAIVALAVRVGMVASRLEYGGQLLSTMVRDALPVWLSGGSPWRPSEPAEVQARFWLEETDRILAQDSSAENLIGAAWLLDTWVANRWWSTDPELCSEFDTISAAPRSDTGAKDSVTRAHKRYLELAEQATRTAPDDPQIWRYCCALWSEELVNTPHDKSRDQHLLALLDQAREHDPGNGVYDYLAANQLFYSGAEIGVRASSHDLMVTVRDPQRIAQAVERFERAQQQPFVKYGSNAWQPVLHFLEFSRAPTREPLPIVAHSVPMGVDRWGLDQLVQFQFMYVAQGDPPDTERFCRQMLRMSEQIEPEFSRTNRWQTPTFELRLQHHLAEALRGLNNPELSAEVDKRLVALLQKKLMRDSVMTMLPAGRTTAAIVEEIFLAFAACALLPAVALATAIALASWLVAHPWRPGSDAPHWRLAPLRHGWCWLLTGLASLVLLGIVPAGLVDESNLRMYVHLLATIVPGMLILGLLLMGFRRARTSRSRTVLLGAILFAGAFVARFPFHIDRMTAWFGRILRVDQLSDMWWMYNRLQSLPVAPVIEGLLQWKYHRGLSITLSVALLLIATWYWLWSGNPKAGATSRGARVRGAAGEVYRSAAVAAAVGWLLLLAILPTVLEDADAAATARIAHFRDYYQAGGAFDTALKAIAAEPEKMEELRVWAEQQIQSDRAQQR